MRIFIIICLFFLNLAVSCPPPFNNHLFAEDPDALAEAVLDLAKADPNLGWAEAVKSIGNPHTIWPQGPDKVTLIHYCFANKESYDYLQPVIDKAWKIWHNVIGNPGAATGHTLKFEEVKSPFPQIPYCYLDYAKRIWNPHFHAQTVVVQLGSDNVFAQSVLGFLPYNAEGRHAIWIGRKASKKGNMVPYVAHELGECQTVEPVLYMLDTDLWRSYLRTMA